GRAGGDRRSGMAQLAPAPVGRRGVAARCRQRRRSPPIPRLRNAAAVRAGLRRGGLFRARDRADRDMPMIFTDRHGTWPLACGLAVLAGVWIGPLPEWSRHSFAAHMAMHMSVVAIAA